MPHIRHLYPGGNTSRGFYSYYDQVIRPEAATRIFILKGGPGVGKSTLMRRLGEEIAEHRDVEFLHCSSDNDSLDGIVVPSAGVMMVDGTAPHIVDPVLPGAVDGIVNLGECLNQTALHEKAQQIFETNRRISSQFQRAYRYLAAAAQVRADAHALYAQHTDRAALNARRPGQGAQAVCRRRHARRLRLHAGIAQGHGMLAFGRPLGLSRRMGAGGPCAPRAGKRPGGGNLPLRHRPGTHRAPIPAGKGPACYHRFGLPPRIAGRRGPHAGFCAPDRPGRALGIPARFAAKRRAVRFARLFRNDLFCFHLSDTLVYSTYCLKLFHGLDVHDNFCIRDIEQFCAPGVLYPQRIIRHRQHRRFRAVYEVSVGMKFHFLRQNPCE